MMILILWNLLKLSVWPSTSLNFMSIPGVPEKNMYPGVLEYNVLPNPKSLIVLFKFYLSICNFDYLLYQLSRTSCLSIPYDSRLSASNFNLNKLLSKQMDIWIWSSEERSNVECQYRNPCILMLFSGQETGWDPKSENKKEKKKPEDSTMGHSSVYRLGRWGGIDRIWLKTGRKKKLVK